MTVDHPGSGTRRVAETVQPPGAYDDGPVFLRVHRARASGRWPVAGFDREVNDRTLAADPVYDWVRVPQDNSRCGFADRDRLVEDHRLPDRAVAVVRFRPARTDRPVR